MLPRQQTLALGVAVLLIALASAHLGRGADAPSQEASPPSEPVGIERLDADTDRPHASASITAWTPPTPTETKVSAGRAPSEPAPATEDLSRHAHQAPFGSLVVAPEGGPLGAGTLEDPLDLATALRDGGAEPGDTVLLRGGTYEGEFTSEIAGTRDKPVVVRSYPGEWAVLAGRSDHTTTLTIRGSDIWLRDLEVTRIGDPKRRSTNAGPHPDDVGRSKANGIDVFGERTKLINLVIHDVGDGIGFWRAAADAEIYGCLIYNNGWAGEDHGWGHGIYMTNQSGTKRITNTILHDNFGYGIHAYAVNGRTDHITIDGVTSFENGAPTGRRNPNVFVGTQENPPRNVIVRHSDLHHRLGASGINLRLGISDVVNHSVTLEHNVVSGGSPVLSMQNWSEAKITDNTFVAGASGSSGRLVDLRVPDGIMRTIETHDYTWDRNDYRDPGLTEQDPFALTDVSGRHRMDFPTWKSETGFDSVSMYRRAAPSNVDVIVRPNAYERGRATIVVRNWAGAGSVEVDPDAVGLTRGAAFEVRDAQRFHAEPVVSGTVTDAPIRIPLRPEDVAQPQGTGGEPIASTLPAFGAFILIPR